MLRTIQSILIATLLGTTLAGCVVAPAHPVSYTHLTLPTNREV